VSLLKSTVVRLATSASAVVLLCAACSGTALEPSRVGTGVWGGDHVTFTVGNSSNHLEFDCAHGDIPGVLSVNRGELAASGTFVREHGGPIRVDEPLDSHPALYSGTITGSTMHLSIRLNDSGDVIGSFSLVRGISGRVVKCL
jgi:hypothetical protein